MTRQEASDFMTKTFWPWFRKNTYPALADKGLGYGPTIVKDDDTVWPEHLRKAAKYLKNFSRGSTIHPQDLLDTIPKHIRIRAKEALVILQKNKRPEGG